MRVLVDTHAFLWYTAGDAHLSPDARRLIDDRSNDRLLSVGALWEMAIKSSQKKLQLGGPFDLLIPALLRANGLRLLGVSVEHAAAVSTLPFPRSGHRDPFDRLMVAQCLVEGVPIISQDGLLDDYAITRLW